MGILDGKRILITGVLTEASIAFAAARLAQEQGAEVILSSFGRQMKITSVIAERLPQSAQVIELDATDEEHLAALPERLGGNIDGIVHAIAFAPKDALGGVFLDTPFESASNAFHVSAYSLKSIAVAARPVLNEGAGIVGLTFDARIAWPAYDWMGVAKAALESTSRYLAKYMGADGVRVNLVSAGPLKTTAAKSIPGFEAFEDVWSERAPLGWDQTDTEPAGKAIVALLSEWFPATTGEMVHVDGGLHATGA